MKRLFSVLVIAGLAVGCRDATEPGAAILLHPAFSAVAAESWTPLAAMAASRNQHGGLTGPDGRFYALEGIGQSGYVHGSEAYNPASDAWSPIASPGGWCCGGAARGGDGRLYVIGGEWESDGSMSRVSAYDVSENAWATAAPLAVSRDVLAAATGPDGRIYAIGGAEDGDARRTLASVDVYDPATNSWTAGVPMGQRRWYHAAALGPDGRIYAFGGLDFFNPLASAEVLDPVTNQWSPIAPMPESRYAAAAVAGADGLIYVVGGVVNNGGDGRSVIAYDPATDTWSDAPALTTGRTQLAAAMLADGRIIATGGYDPAVGVVGTVEALSTATNQAPVAAAGPDQTLACVAGGADARLDGTASSDPDNDPLSFDWLEGANIVATGAVASVHLGLGAHLLTLRVTDDDGATAEDDVTVTVQDVVAPVIDLKRFKKTLWPADDRLHLVARVTAADACQNATLKVTVTSNQSPRKDWRHRQERDWKVLANDAGGFDVYVRAELESWRGDRVYTISAVSEDGSANRATARTEVRVPRNRPRGWHH